MRQPTPPDRAGPPAAAQAASGGTARRRIHLFLEVSWGKPENYGRRRRPVVPGLRIALAALALAVAIIGFDDLLVGRPPFR